MARRMAAARAAKARLRMDGGDVRPQAVPLPGLRREVVVRDYDFGLVEYRFEFFRADRIDCYQLVCDGVVLAERIGWARGLAMIRSGFVRVGASPD